MPIDFIQWLSGGGSIVQSQWQLRAQIQASRINDKPVDVSLIRNGVKLDPQTIRIEFDNNAGEANSEFGSAAMRRVILFGVKGHPELDDFNVAVWDTFTMDEQEFTVRTVNKTLIGQIQAHAEAVG